MTNLEWLYQNNKEGLISIICAKGMNDCSCLLKDFCEEVTMQTDMYCCSEKWLNAEH